MLMLRLRGRFCGESAYRRALGEDGRPRHRPYPWPAPARSRLVTQGGEKRQDGRVQWWAVRVFCFLYGHAACVPARAVTGRDGDVTIGRNYPASRRERKREAWRGWRGSFPFLSGTGQSTPPPVPPVPSPGPSVYRARSRVCVCVLRGFTSEITRAFRLTVLIPLPAFCVFL